MRVQYRPLRPDDISEARDLVLADPLNQSRYGDVARDLKPAWLRLLGTEAFRAIVLEDLSASRPRLIGVGISAFLSEDFVRATKTPPLCWAGPEIVKLTMAGNAPLLSDAQLCEANTSTGLTNFSWHGSICTGARERPEVSDCLMRGFVEQHRGYFLKELLVQAESEAQLMLAVNTGGLVWDPANRCYVSYGERCPEEVLRRPHLLGLTRSLALQQHGSWVGSLFVYEPPEFAFSRAEQRLLAAAMAGGTDEELAEDLHVSLSAVKKTWRGIHDRMGQRSPNFLEEGPTHTPSNRRGREKKQHVTAYVRNHPEELRPISRKLLTEHARRWASRDQNDTRD